MKLIDAVGAWRDELYRIFMPNKSLTFIYNGTDIFDSVKSDLNWLAEHPLS